jgi:hypothetical protein
MRLGQLTDEELFLPGHDERLPLDPGDLVHVEEVRGAKLVRRGLRLAE